MIKYTHIKYKYTEKTGNFGAKILEKYVIYTMSKKCSLSLVYAPYNKYMLEIF